MFILFLTVDKMPLWWQTFLGWEEEESNLTIILFSPYYPSIHICFIIVIHKRCKIQGNFIASFRLLNAANESQISHYILLISTNLHRNFIMGLRSIYLSSQNQEHGIFLNSWWPSSRWDAKTLQKMSCPVKPLSNTSLWLKARLVWESTFFQTNLSLRKSLKSVL